MRLVMKSSRRSDTAGTATILLAALHEETETDSLCFYHMTMEECVFCIYVRVQGGIVGNCLQNACRPVAKQSPSGDCCEAQLLSHFSFVLSALESSAFLQRLERRLLSPFIHLTVPARKETLLASFCRDPPGKN